MVPHDGISAGVGRGRERNLSLILHEPRTGPVGTVRRQQCVRQQGALTELSPTRTLTLDFHSPGLGENRCLSVDPFSSLSRRGQGHKTDKGSVSLALKGMGTLSGRDAEIKWGRGRWIEEGSCQGHSLCFLCESSQGPLQVETLFAVTVVIGSKY